MKDIEGIEGIATKIVALGALDRFAHCTVAFRPKGTALPYFGAIDHVKTGPASHSLSFLEGWQTLHDYVRVGADANYGYRSHEFEFPQYRLFFAKTGGVKLFRHDIGYVPVEVRGDGLKLMEHMLWQMYGVLLRLEENPRMALKYADERAMFARVEVEDGKWEDRPLRIPQSPEIVERVNFRVEDLKAAKDMPMARENVVNLDFALLPHLSTKEVRPRCVYELRATDAASGAVRFASQVSLMPETGLKSLWEGMPQQVLSCFIKLGGFPSEIRVISGRVFRVLRPLCMELPFKLSLHDRF